MNKIHKVMKVRGELHYLCNQACGITKGKFTIMNGRVTCKNCKKILKTGGSQ